MTYLKADEDLDLQNDPMSYRRKGDAILFASYRLLLVLLQNTEQTWCIGFSLSGNIPYVTSALTTINSARSFNLVHLLLYDDSISRQRSDSA